MTIRKKLACYLMLGFVISLGCAKAHAESEPDEIMVADLLTVAEPQSEAESRLRVIRLTTRSGATGFGDYLDYGLPDENADKVLARLVNRYAAQGHNCLLYTSPSPRDLSTSRMPSSA